MCIQASVGKHASNKHADVKTVQILLNLNNPSGSVVNEDGHGGGSTVAAIEQFQKETLEVAKPDGRVDPGGKTLAGLRDGLPAGLSEAKMRGIMIHASRSAVAKYYSFIRSKMIDYEINTPLRMAHFLAQLAAESAEFVYSEEIASGQAYEDRDDLGNTQKGDGRRFKGRGLIQITGRDNYTKYSTYRKPNDYTTDAGAALLATDAETAVDASCWFWSKLKNLNGLADSDNITEITMRVNGSVHGHVAKTAHLSVRQATLTRAKFFLAK